MSKIKSGLFYCASLFVLFCSVALAPAESFALEVAGDADFSMFKPNGSINDEVEASINVILQRNKNSKTPPNISDIAPLLEYLLVIDGSSSSVHPAKRNEGMGIFWGNVVNKPFKEFLHYFYNFGIPHELLYPASLRRGDWIAGSELMTSQKQLWELVDTLGDTPIVFTGDEFEEITPETASGCYYTYNQKRTMILLKYKGVPMLLSVGWQDGESEAGKKAYFLGEYSNWDFVFTKEVGATTSGIGWMSTYIYNAASITLSFPKSANTTGYSMFKWVKAGWSGLNVVKRSHITAGADRNFTGMLAVLDPEKGVTPEELESINKQYNVYDRAAMLKEATPYAQELGRLSKNADVLDRDEFQALLADGKYAERLSDEELRSLLKVLALKRRLGKTVLGD